MSRISYNHDIVFKITRISGDNVFLKGINLRLYADAPIEDVVIVADVSLDDDAIIQKNVRDLKIDRSNYFYLPGKILHIDTDCPLSNSSKKGAETLIK